MQWISSHVVKGSLSCEIMRHSLSPAASLRPSEATESPPPFYSLPPSLAFPAFPPQSLQINKEILSLFLLSPANSLSVSPAPWPRLPQHLKRTSLLPAHGSPSAAACFVLCPFTPFLGTCLVSSPHPAWVPFPLPFLISTSEFPAFSQTCLPLAQASTWLVPR